MAVWPVAVGDQERAPVAHPHPSPDPFDEVWEEEILPLLQGEAAGRLRATTIIEWLEELSRAAVSFGQQSPAQGGQSTCSMWEILADAEEPCPAGTVSSRPFSPAGLSASLIVHFHGAPDMAQDRPPGPSLLLWHKEKPGMGPARSCLPRLRAGTMGPRPGV